MIILDTNVISVIMSPRPERVVMNWLDQTDSRDLWTTTINLYEVRFGLERLPAGSKKNSLQSAFEQLVNPYFAGRICDFDQKAAHEAAAISAELAAKGTPIEIRDVFIAGIARSNQATLATRNERHFKNTLVKLLNPWDT